MNDSGWKPPLDFETGPEGAPPPEAIWREGCEERAWPFFDDEDKAWFGLFGDTIRRIEPETEADPKAVGFDLLISFGNLIGPSPHCMAGGSRHDGRLFGITVGRTAKARKGTSAAHVLDLCAHIDRTWLRRQLRGIGSGEGFIDFAAGKIAAADGQVYEDRRTMVREGEFARLLVATGREGSTLSGLLRDAWDQSVLSSVTRHNTVIVEDAHVSLSGHITSYELTERLATTEMFNGFANRLLWACVKRSRVLASGGNLGEDDWRDMAAPIRKVVEKARRTGQVRRDAEAERLWKTLYEGPLAVDPPGLVGMLTARAEPQVIRMALLFALFDGSPVVRVEHLEQAHEWWKFSYRSVEYLFGASDTLGGTDATKLLLALREAGCKGLTRTEQFAKVFSRKRTAKELEALRLELANQGLIWTASAKVEGADKPITTTWAVRPGWRG